MPAAKQPAAPAPAPASADKNPLEDMAKRMVGDGKEPNLYFVCTHDEGCVAIFIDEEDAIEFAESIDADMVEDRLVGWLWGDEEDAPDSEEDEAEEEEEEEDDE